MSKIRKQIQQVGKAITAKEVKQIAAKTGYTPQSVVTRAKDSGVKVKPSAKTFVQKEIARRSESPASVSNTTKVVPGFNENWQSSWQPSDVSGIYETVQRGQENLVNLEGQWARDAAVIGANAQVSSAGIRADADKEVARAYADAQKYASSLGLEGIKYGADKESEWRQAVANIEVKGKLDLQPIINAGLERVAGIEAQASRDVAETTGKYSLESMKQRTEADKSIGKMQLAGSMYGLLGSVFG